MMYASEHDLLSYIELTVYVMIILLSEQAGGFARVYIRFCSIVRDDS